MIITLIISSIISNIIYITPVYTYICNAIRCIYATSRRANYTVLFDGFSPNCSVRARLPSKTYIIKYIIHLTLLSRTYIGIRSNSATVPAYTNTIIIYYCFFIFRQIYYRRRGMCTYIIPTTISVDRIFWPDTDRAAARRSIGIRVRHLERLATCLGHRHDSTFVCSCVSVQHTHTHNLILYR